MNKYLQKPLSVFVVLCMILTSVFSWNMTVFAGEVSAEADDRGDIDGVDGVTVNDAVILLDYVLDKGAYKGDYSKEMLAYMGDVNSDGTITARDVSEILNKALNGDYKFSGKKPNKPVPPTTEATTEGDVQTTTEGDVQTTTETVTEATTEAIVTGDPADAVYKGYDIVVDKRIAESNPTRDEQPIVKTVREAIALADGGTEAKPIVIGVVPELYREQVVVKKPWITLKKITNSTSTEDEVTLTWYYLEGYTYDNVGSDGYWDPANPKANEGGTKGVPQWGQSTYIDGSATGFRAEGIYFENSSNLYITEEELAANVRVNPTNTGPSGGAPAITLPERNTLKPGYGTGDKVTVKLGTGASESNVIADVRAKRWRERGAALYTKADKVVLIDCKVIGTQDSLGVCGTGNRAYFKDCYLAGGVDFICGGTQSVFDNCEIHWQSSPYKGDGDGGGALTATKNDGYPAKGYLFWNCKITGNPTTEQVQFGRPWSAQNAETIWVNTISDISKINNKPMISEAGWASMGCDPDLTRGFFEYNSKDINGNKLDTSKRKGTTSGKFKGGVLDSFDVIKYNPYNYTAYKGDKFDGWDPSGSKAIYDGIEKDIESVVFKDSYDADFTLPEAPAGYEVRYESDSQNAVIGADGKSVTIKRPPFGSSDAEVNFTAYLKKKEADKENVRGTEKVYTTSIAASTDEGSTFKLTGAVNLTFSSDKDLTATLDFAMPDGTSMSNKEVVIPAGSVTAAYDAGNLYADMPITLTITLDDEKYSVVGGDVHTIPAGTGGTPMTYDINIGLKEIMNVTSGGVPALAGTAPAGYTMEAVAEYKGKANVYHYKNTNSTKSTHGYYWDLASIVANTAGQSIEDLKAADSVTLEFSINVPDAGDWGSPINAIDILGNGDTSKFVFAPKANDSRYVRFLLGRWNQVNAIDSTVGGISGSSHSGPQQLNLVGKLNEEGGKNVWKKITATIDFKNQKVVMTGEGSANPVNEFKSLPANIDRSKLYMVFYPAENKSSTDEYYFSDVKVSYDRFVPAEDTSKGVSVSGTVTDGIKSVTLVNKEQPIYKHTADIAENKTMTFAGKIPAGVYEVRYTTDEASKFKDVTGTGVALEDGKYYLTVSGADITDLKVAAETVVGFDAAEKAVDAMLVKYTDVKTTADGNVYTLKEALPKVSEDGYEIEIKEGCSYVNPDGSLIEQVVSAETAGDLVYNIVNIGSKDSEEYTVKVLPAVISSEKFVRTFDGLAVGSKVETGSFTANIVKDSELAPNRGNVLVFSNTSNTFNDKVTAVSFADLGLEAGRTYAISFDIMKTDGDDSGKGWRVNLTDTAGLLWTGTKIEFNAEAIKGDKYSGDSVYGTTAAINSATVPNEWVNYTFVSNTATGNVDVYKGGSYVTSYKGQTKVPAGIEFATHYVAGSKIYLDNVVLYEYPTAGELETELNGVITDGLIPSEAIKEAKEITVPSKTASGKVIKWTSSNSSRITITENDENAKIAFADPTGNFEETLTAEVEHTLPYTGSPSGDKVTFKKDYTINFESDNVVKYDLTVNNKTAGNAIKITVLRGENVEVAETETLTHNLASGTYKVKFTSAEGYKISEVKIGENAITAGSDGSYTVDLSANVTLDVTSREVLTGYTAAEDAVKSALSGAGTLNGDVYTIDRAFTVPAVEKYEISIADNSFINADGTLKRAAAGTAVTAEEVTFTIKNTDADTTEDYKLKVLVPAKTGDKADENFEGLNIGDKVNGATVAYKEGRGRYVKFSQPEAASLDVVKYDTLESGKKYEIGFDIMRIADTVQNGNHIPAGKTSFDNAGMGWKISFTNTGYYNQYFAYMGNQFKIFNSSIKNDDTKDPIISGCESEKWYSLKFIVDMTTNNIDVYLRNENETEYTKVTSVKVAENNVPNLVGVREEWGSRMPNDYVCFDNVYVKEITSN